MKGIAMDNDYSLSRVPDEAKQPFWKILFIRIGAICCVSQLMLGAALGFGMTFWDAFLATMLGSVLLQVVSWALGTAAAHEGLSTSLLSRWTGFGKGGSALFGGVVAISMVGWFGVQNAVFGQGMATIVGLTALIQTLSYKHLYYELGPDEFNLYSGIFNKKRVHVPYPVSYTHLAVYKRQVPSRAS